MSSRSTRSSRPTGNEGWTDRVRGDHFMSPGRPAVGVFVVVVVLGATLVPVGAVGQVIGSPEIAVHSPDNELTPGRETTLPVFVSNAGNLLRPGPEEYVERVTTARAMTLEVREGNAPMTVNTGRYPVGTVPEGTSGPFPIAVTVPADAPPGTYRLPVRVTYSYTFFVDDSSDPPEFNTATRDSTRHLTVRIRDAARFAVVNASTTTRINGRGNTTVTVRNVGTAVARDATVRLVSPSDEVLLGTRSRAARAFAGVWEPGATRTVRFATSVTSDAVRRGYPLTAVVEYEDEDGITRTSENLTASVTPGPEQTFRATVSSGTLYVGEPGVIRGTVANAGPEAVDNAVLVYTSSNPNIRPVDSEVSLGRLEPGQRREFSLEVSVTDAAAAADLQLNLTVRYRDGQGNAQRSDSLEPTVSVSPEREWLAVTPERTTFGVDTDNRMTVRVTNVEAVPLSEVRARIATEEPFTSESPLAYVRQLDTGESATLAFQITVAEDAVPTQSSVTMTVTANRPDGETITVDEYVVPVTVVEESGTSDTTVLAAGALVVVVALLAGWWWLRG